MTSTEQIWDEFHGRLLGFVRKRIHDESTSQDIVQDVFEKIHLNLPSLRDEKKLHSWIYQVARNRITDHFREKHSDSTVNDVTELTEDENELLAAAECCLKRLIGDLPTESRSAIEKTYFSEKSQKEIAAEEGLSYTAYKSRVQRARAILEEQIISCCKSLTCARLDSSGEKKCDC